MEQRTSWETNNYSAGKGCPMFYENQIIYYIVYNSPPISYNLNQTNSIHTSLSHYFSKLHFNIIFPSTQTHPCCSLPSLKIVRLQLCMHLFPMRTTCPAHLTHLGFIALIMFSRIRTMNIVIVQFLHSLATAQLWSTIYVQYAPNKS
jgi:hypothetical protein